MTGTETAIAMVIGAAVFIFLGTAAFGVICLIKDCFIPAFRNWRIRRLFKPFRDGARVTFKFLGQVHKGVVKERYDCYLCCMFDSKKGLGMYYVHPTEISNLSLIKLSPFEQRVQDYIDKELAH